MIIENDSIKFDGVDKQALLYMCRPKGIWHLLDECSNAGYYCSNCNKKVVKDGWSDTVKKIKFCPNCGADMREVEE